MEILYNCERHQDEVWYVQFSHNGRYFASASKDTSVIIWRVDTGEPVHTLIGHKEPVSFLSWSPDDTMILTCGNDKKLKLWDMDSGSCKRTFSRHSETVSSCAWLPDNERFVSGGLDKNIFLWVRIRDEKETSPRSRNPVCFCLFIYCSYSYHSNYWSLFFYSYMLFS
jgi:WD repeat-containing protein 26